jgi:phosphoribosyl 1,2-cyclic phosphate phosphodiesterase
MYIKSRKELNLTFAEVNRFDRLMDKELLKITFLGTGTSQGIPVIGCTHEVCLSDDPKDNRLRSSVLLEWNDKKYVIDCGPDFRQQMIRAGVSRLDGILFTHFHADHTSGLDDTRPFTQRYGKLPIYGKKDVIDNLIKRFDYIFETRNKYYGAPDLDINIIDNELFRLKDTGIIPIEVKHGKLLILGFRIMNFAYITDAKKISDKEKKKLKGVEILVVNALRKEPHPTHYNLEEALQLISEIKPQKAYLTHISHRMGLHAEVSKILPENVFLAYDGLQLTL